MLEFGRDSKDEVSSRYKTEVWPRFQSYLKLLLWNKVDEWVKVLNALGPLCLWKCFSWYFRFILPGAAYQNCFYLFTKIVLLLFKWIQNQCFLVWNCSDLDLRTTLWGGGPSGNISFSKGRCQKRTGLCGEDSQVADPPPVWETPVIKKKSWVYFSFYNLSNIFGLHQKITISNKLNSHQEGGLGQSPHPQFGNFSHIIPFFSDRVPRKTPQIHFGIPKITW